MPMSLSPMLPHRPSLFNAPRLGASSCAILLLLLLLPLLAAADWIGATERALPTYHDSALDVVFTTGHYNSTLIQTSASSSPSSTAPIPATLPAYFTATAPTPACSLDKNDPVPASVGTCGNAASAPFATVPICIAYNFSSLSTSTSTGELALNATEAGRLFGIGGSKNSLRLATTGDETILANAAAVSIVVASLSSTLEAFQRRVAGVTNQPALSTAAHSADVTVSDDAAVVAALRQGGRVGLLPAPMATAARLPCAAFRREHTVGRRVQWQHFRPRLSSTDSRLIAVSKTDAIASGDSGTAYPFLAPLFVSASAQCSVSNAAAASYTWRLMARLGDAAFSAHLSRWGIARRSSADISAIVGLWGRVLCDPPMRIPARGSSAVLALIAELSLRRIASNPRIIDYAGTGSGSGVRAVEDHTVTFGASDAPYTDADFAKKPAMLLLPAVAFAVSVVVNLGLSGVTAVTLPQCLVPALFNGTVTSWQDARIVGANPFIVLPNSPVIPVVRSDKSGTTSVFTTGLAAIEMACWGGTSVTPGKTWTGSLPASSQTAAGTSGVLAAVRAAAGTIGYAGHGDALAEGMTEALVQPSGGVAVGPSTSAVQAALASAKLDRRNRVELTVVPGAYPFAGVTYFLVDGDLPLGDNCSSYRDGLLFMRYVLTDTNARAVGETLNYVPLPEVMGETMSRALDTVRCGGVSLLAPTPPEPDRTLLIALVVGLCVIVCLAAAVAAVLWSRRHRHCPSDQSKPFAAFFVTTKNEEALLEVHGDAAVALFRRLRFIVEKAADRHECHVARSLDAHHLIVSKSVPSALSAICEISQEVSKLCVLARTEAGPAHRPSIGGRAMRSRPRLSRARLSSSARPHAPDSARPLPSPPPPQQLSKPGEQQQQQNQHRSSLSQNAPSNLHSVLQDSVSKSQQEAALPVLAVGIGLSFATGVIDLGAAGSVVAAYSGAVVSNAAALADAAPAGGVRVHSTATDVIEISDVGESVFGKFSACGEQHVGSGKDARICEVMAFAVLGQASQVGTPRSPPPVDGIDMMSCGTVETDSTSRTGTTADGAGAGASSALANALETATNTVAVRKVAVIAVVCPALNRAVPANERAKFASMAAEVHEAVLEEAATAGAALVKAMDGVFVLTLGAERIRPQQLHLAVTLAFALQDRLESIDNIGDVFAGLAVSVTAAGKSADPQHPVFMGRVASDACLLAHAARHLGVRVACAGRLRDELPLHPSRVMDLLHWPRLECPVSRPLQSVDLVCALSASAATAVSEDEWMYQLEEAERADSSKSVDALFERLLTEGAMVPSIDEIVVMGVEDTPDPVAQTARQSLERAVSFMAEAKESNLRWQLGVIDYAKQRTCAFASPYA